MASKLLNIIALATLAILTLSHSLSHVTALSLESSHNFVPRHNALIAKRSGNSRRCKARTSPLASSSTFVSSAQTSSTKISTHAPAVAPTPTHTTDAPQPTAAVPSNGGSGNGKVGLDWANSNDNELANFLPSKKVSGVITWSPWKPAVMDQFPNVEFCPMLWGTKQIDDFTSLVKAGYASTVLGFNEPDQSGQSALDPTYAATLWKQHIQPLKSQGYRLVSPAPTNAPSGKIWLQNFLAACSDCTIDVIATHIYLTDPQQFIAHCVDYHNTFGREIWVTEFACENFGSGPQCSPDDVTNFVNIVTGWMDETEFMGKYFMFGPLHDMGNVNPDNQLIGPDGKPNALGWNYLT